MGTFDEEESTVSPKDNDDDSFKENEQADQTGKLEDLKIDILNFDAPKYYNFSKPKYQKHLRSLEKVLFPSSLTNSSSLITSPPNNTPLTSEVNYEDEWFERMHSGHETSQVDTPHPLISPTPPKNKSSSNQKLKKTCIKGSPARITATSKVSESSQVSFSTPMMFVRSPVKFSPIVKSPLTGKHHQPGVDEDELLDTGLIKYLPKITAVEDGVKRQVGKKKNSETSFLEEEVEESLMTPLVQRPITFESKEERNLLSYSPSPPKLATHLSSSSINNSPSTPIENPIDPGPKKLLNTKAQRVLTGVNLNSRKRNSSSSEAASASNYMFNAMRANNSNSVFSNQSTPSKAVKKIKIEHVDYCPPFPVKNSATITASTQAPLNRTIPINSNIITAKKPQVKLEDLKRLLNEHNKRVKNSKK